jgi:hypothetical protein
MGKFNRTYVMRVEAQNGESIEIAMPFSVDFSISRSMNGGANTGTFTIYNLNSDTRAKIFKDPFVLEKRACQFFAGYDDGVKTVLPMIFNGQLSQASSSREGTEFKTEIEAFDGAFAMTQGNMSQSQSAGQSMKDTLLGMMKQLPGIEGATVGEGHDQKSQRGQVFMGNPVEFLKMQSSNRFFIDQNHAFILADDEVLRGDIEEIDASTGLIGTPKKAGQIIELQLIFEPRLTLAQQLKLTSLTNPTLNGEHKVVEIIHNGSISPTVGGAVTTTVKLYKGPVPWVEVRK